MIITHINDCKQAQLAWLHRKLEIEEATLPDYPRPLKVITEKDKSLFQKKVAQYGFAQAVYKNFLP